MIQFVTCTEIEPFLFLRAHLDIAYPATSIENANHIIAPLPGSPQFHIQDPATVTIADHDENGGKRPYLSSAPIFVGTFVIVIFLVFFYVAHATNSAVVVMPLFTTTTIRVIAAIVIAATTTTATPAVVIATIMSVVIGQCRRVREWSWWKGDACTQEEKKRISARQDGHGTVFLGRS